MKKKIIGLLLSVLLLLTAVPTSAEFIDVHGTKYEKAVQLLSDLGIVQGVSPDFFLPNEPVKRGDAALLVARISGIAMPEVAEIFSDVPKEHYASAAVALSYRLGIISGTSETTFTPDAFVTGEQMAKMLVTLAGYKVHAEAAGGYPSGYLTVANRCGILEGVKFGEGLTRGETSKMIYNTLFVKPAEKTGYGEDDGVYRESEEILLTKNLGIYEVRGILEANAVTAINGLTVKEGHIRILDKTISAPSSLSDKIGHKVTVYYKENDVEELETVSFFEDEDIKTIRLDADDVSGETTKEKLVYQRDEDDKPMSVSLKGAVVILNGNALASFDASDLMPKEGSLYVTEKSDGSFIIVVESYQDFIIESINHEEGMIYYKDNALSEKAFDYEDRDVTYTVLDANGNPFDITKAKEDMAISVAHGKKVCKVYVSDLTVTGEITETTSEAVIIDGMEISFSDWFYGTRPTLGSAVKLSLNFAGKAVSKSDDISARKYGYLMVGKYEGKGLSAAAKVKLLTTDNKILAFEAAENVTVNGVIIGKNKLFNDSQSLSYEQQLAVGTIYQDGKTIEQLIVYEENANGEIVSITTAHDGTESMARDENTFTLHYKTDSGMFIEGALRTFHSKYRLPEKAIVFSVGGNYTGNNDNQYTVLTGMAVQHSNHYPDLKLYDLNEVNDISVMVTSLKMSDETAMFNSEAVLVKEVVRAETEDGTVCDGVRVVGAGGRETVLYNVNDIQATFALTAITDATKDPACAGGTPAKIAISSLSPGDVIKYQALNNELLSAMVCLRGTNAKEEEKAFEGTTQQWPYDSNDYYQSLWVYAEALAVGDASFRFMAKNSAGIKMERIHTFGGATVLIYDTQKNIVKVGNKTSLCKGDKFFASRLNSFEHLIVVYR